MQDRYTGDIGDYAKYGLLRALAGNDSLGIAWYLYPDENHNGDGRHTDYLNHPDRWRHLDPVLFDGLKRLVGEDQRTVRAIERSGLFPSAVFSGECLTSPLTDQEARGAWRRAWFARVQSALSQTQIVFADADNGLCDDADYAWASASYWKRMPLLEAKALARGRPAVIYHHNSRFKGGHALEIQHWIARLGHDTLAIYWRAYSNRTLFIVNPSEVVLARARAFVACWRDACELHTWQGQVAGTRESIPSKAAAVPTLTGSALKVCPECGHRFQGGTWGGIDAHWKAKHEAIMPYEEAWPLIRAGSYGLK